jgi:hypothetical protein
VLLEGLEDFVNGGPEQLGDETVVGAVRASDAEAVEETCKASWLLLAGLG